MNRQEIEFLAVLRAEFTMAATDRCQVITTGLLELEKNLPKEKQAEVIETIYRQSHSLKGEARAVNFPEIESVCQAMESIFSAWKKGPFTFFKQTFDVLHGAIDSLKKMFAEEGGGNRIQSDEILARLGPLLKKIPTGAKLRTTLTSASIRSESAQPEREADKNTAPGRMVLDETVRMPLARLELLLLGLEEMLAVKLNLIRRAEALRTAATLIEEEKRQVAKINTEVHLLLGGDLPPSLGDVLERHQAMKANIDEMMSGLARDAERDTHTMTRLVDDLLDQSKTLLLLPFNSLLGMLPKLVRDLCHDQGKDAEVIIRGGEIEIDKRILQEMKDAIIHLIRNCVDHGIEFMAVRERHNKPGRGTITVEVLPVEAGNVELVIQDDGAGIDVEAVKRAAIKLGVISAGEAAELSRDAAISLIFRSSVSTSPTVTAVSGRGLGMAIVKERVDALGGQVSVETRPSQGSKFVIRLPTSLATFRGTFVQEAGQWFIFPSYSVERVARIRTDQMTTVEGRAAISTGHRTLLLARLAAVLGIAPREQDATHEAFVQIVIASVGEKRMAFRVDEILTEQEVLAKSFLKPVSRVRNIAGATVMPSGRIVPILHVADLIKSSVLTIMPQAPDSPGNDAVPVPESPKNLLLVEDSIISRMLFKSILESAGYVVKTAVDGEDAWEALQSGMFNAVVSDVEMPRMNGFELTSRIRKDARFGDKPVILVTALSSPEDRVRGVEVGANAYIVKSSFDQSDLLEALRRVV